MKESNKEKELQDREQAEGILSEEIEVMEPADEAHDETVDEAGEIAQSEEIETLKKEKEELENRILRLQAEFDNYKKRTQKEKEAERKYKAQDIANDLLPVVDNFHRALQTEVDDAAKGFAEGVEMVYRQLEDALKNHGITEIESVGKEFDPNLHHAVMQEDDPEKESNIVLEELQKGYMLKDRVIRPAMVKVNK